MDGSGIFPAKPPESPGFPSNPYPLVFEGFKGLNTKPSRNDIEDDEMYIADGWFPIGKSNLRTLPDVGTSLYTASGTLTVIRYYFANLNANPIAVVLLSNGSLVQVNTTNGNTTAIATSGTITTPANGIGVTQSSGNQFIIIVAPQNNGFWVWDGTILYTAGTLSPIVTVTDGGTSGYTSAATVTVAGGSGSGAAFSVTTTNGIITAIKVTNAGSGWTVGQTVTVAITQSGSSGDATATTTIMPFGISGTVVETFVNRTWIGNGANLLFSAPEAITDFATSDGGGTTTSQDSFLRVAYYGLVQTNGFLYLLGDSSLNAVSGVTTSAATPPVTTFTNQNVDPQVGSPWKDSVQVFSRNIVFANSFGIHVSYGGAVTKISSPLDGIYNSVPNVGTFSPSSAVASIFGIQVYMLLYPIVDQWTGNTVNKLLMWDGQKFFTSQQGVSLTYIASQEINSVLTAWGTDGKKIYPLFQTPSNNFLKVVQSKLWAAPGYFYTKQVNRFFGLIFYNTAGGVTTLYADNELGKSQSAQVSLSSGGGFVTWVNGSSALVQFRNSSSQNVVWPTFLGFGVFKGAIGQNGVLIGMTLTTTDADDVLTSITMFSQVFQTGL